MNRPLAKVIWYGEENYSVDVWLTAKGWYCAHAARYLDCSLVCRCCAHLQCFFSAVAVLTTLSNLGPQCQVRGLGWAWPVAFEHADVVSQVARTVPDVLVRIRAGSNVHLHDDVTRRLQHVLLNLADDGKA